MPELPAPLAAALAHDLRSPARDVSPISTGAAGGIARCSIGDRRCAVKWTWGAAPAGGLDTCAAEARGRGLLAATEAVRVPRVYAQAEAADGCPAFVVLEWIETHPSPNRRAAGAMLGHALAEMHRHSAHAYGLDHDNYCGPTPQINGWLPSWVDFYRERRLRPQMELARANGRLPAAREARLDRLLDRLDTWIDHRPEPPSLLHGDLWGGNWMIDTDGKPALIDPAVSYGHREAELAMCRLFGGFPDTFFAAYDEAWPPPPGRDERLPLLQFYHLLNHLNLFGESYSIQVDKVLRYYVG